MPKPELGKLAVGDPQGPPEGWTSKDVQAMEDADLISDILYPKCATCPACGCPGSY